MNISKVDNSNSFKGTLSPKVIKGIKKAERLDIAASVRQANNYGEVLSAEKVNAIKDSTNAIIARLIRLAAALPKKAQIVLQDRLDGFYIRGKFADKYTKKDFYVFDPFRNSLMGKLINSEGKYFSIATLADQAKLILSAKDAKDNIAQDIKYSIEKNIKNGKIKSEKALERRYSYYRKEFPTLESNREKHLAMIEEYKKQQEIENENSKYLPLGQRILQKLGF